VQAKEWENAELKCIVSHSLGNGVRTISEYSEFMISSGKAFLLQMQPNFVAYLKLVWHPMLIMLLLVLGIWFLQNFMDLLVNMVDVLNEVICLICFGLDMHWIYVSSCKWHNHINGRKWLESQAHLKRVVVSWAMEILVVAMLNIGEALIPCAWMLWVVHAQNAYDHLVENLYLAISLRMEGCGLSEFGV